MRPETASDHRLFPHRPQALSLPIQAWWRALIHMATSCPVKAGLELLETRHAHPAPGLASIHPFMFHVFMPNGGLSVWFVHFLTHFCSLTCVKVHVHSVPALSSCLCSARLQAYWCVHLKGSRLGLQKSFQLLIARAYVQYIEF